MANRNKCKQHLKPIKTLGKTLQLVLSAGRRGRGGMGGGGGGGGRDLVCARNCSF